nr:MAG TPA: hypothetical protein [Caudoviricetes sp.]
MLINKLFFVLRRAAICGKITSSKITKETEIYV